MPWSPPSPRESEDTFCRASAERVWRSYARGRLAVEDITPVRKIVTWAGLEIRPTLLCCRGDASAPITRVHQVRLRLPLLELIDIPQFILGDQSRLGKLFDLDLILHV